MIPKVLLFDAKKVPSLQGSQRVICYLDSNMSDTCLPGVIVWGRTLGTLPSILTIKQNFGRSVGRERQKSV